MKKYIAHRFQDCSKAPAPESDAPYRYSDLIDLSIGDTDFTTDQRVIDAAFHDASAGYTHYGDPHGDPELIAAIRRAWREDFHQDIAAEEVLITASSCMGMTQALFGLLNPGDEVLVFGPYFFIYKQQIEIAGGKAVEVPTWEEDGYHPREAEIRRAISPRTKAMIVNTPCNPTGAVYDRGVMTMLAGIAQEYDLLVLADEIYTRYLYEGVFIPMRTLPGMANRTVTLNSFSKNFLMTGWRVGCIIAQPDLIRVFQYVNGGMTYTAPSISQRAACRALELRNEIAEEYVAKYKSRVFYAADRISKMPGLTLLRPQGTFYLFPGMADSGLTDEAFCQLLLEEQHLLVSPGIGFGQAGRGHFRIACTISDDKLAEAMNRLEAFEKQLHS